MLRIAVLLLTGFAALPALPAGGSARQAEAGGDPALWKELLERNRRASFTPRTGELARQDLDSGLLNERQRAAALFALGVGREQRERPRLEASALVGSLAERRAALLGLGELGLRVDSLLGEEIRDPEVAAWAFLALLRRGGLGARRLVEELARQGSAVNRPAVEALVGFAFSPESSRPSEAARHWLDLRWEAAQAYGLVDGRAWSTILRDRLLADRRFLDHCIYLAAARFPRPGVKDHLVGALLEEGGPAALRACVRSMPDELAAMLEAGVWSPPEPGGFDAILDEIEREQLETASVALLERAADRPAVRVRAWRLLARAGIFDGLEAIARDWAVLSTEDRIRACAAFGDSGLDEASAWLVGRLQDPSERVQAAVWLARARLRDPEAREHVSLVLSDPTDQRWDDWLGVALELVHDRLIGDLLNAQLEAADTPERVAIAAHLALAGRLSPLDWLRPELREGLPPGQLTLLGLRALARRGSGEDVARLARLFPLEGEGELALEINAVLVRSMIANRNLAVLPLLRAAIWTDPFDRSVLACLLFTEVAGLHALREEVVNGPAAASSRDFRRAGFGLGAWGGLSELQRLQERGRLPAGDSIMQGAFLGAMSIRTH
jgi:hypothetical protein